MMPPCFLLRQILQSLPVEERFHLIEGGARAPFAEPRWEPLHGRWTGYGFEIDAEECKQIEAQAKQLGVDYRVFPIGLWSEPGMQTFEANANPMGGSIHPQNLDFTNRLTYDGPEVQYLCRDTWYPISRQDIEVTTLDLWSDNLGGSAVDFIKLNVQGGELAILQGGEKLLPDVLGMQLEVSFAETYKNRPLFSDIDRHLRPRGFYLFDLTNHYHMGRAQSPVVPYHIPALYPYWGQLIEGYGLYFRDPLAPDQQEDWLERFGVARTLKLAALAELFGQVAFAFEVVNWLALELRRRSRQAEAATINSVLETAAAEYNTLRGVTPDNV